MRDGYDFSAAERGQFYRENAVMRLPEAIADPKREARASGLTDQEIDAESEAWWKE